MLSFDEIANRFKSFEQDEKIFDLDFCNVKFWKLIRFKIFNDVLMSNGLIDRPHAKNKYSLKKKLQYGFHHTLGLTAIKRSENVFVPHPRSLIAHEDIFLRLVLSDNGSIKFFYDKLNYKYRSNEGSFLLIIVFAKILAYLFKPLFKKRYLKNSEIIKNISSRMNLKLSYVENIISFSVVRFLIESTIYKIIFRWMGVKRVYLVVSYGKEALIEAAHSCKAHVYESQHGLICKNHFGYDFPLEQKIPYFPDFVLTFGSIWKNFVDFPSHTKILDNMSGHNLRQMSVGTKRRRILFISQGTVGQELFKIAIALKLKLGNSMDVVFRLHPSENVEPYAEAKRYNIILDATIPKEQALAECLLVVGVASTLIIEALFSSCYAVIYKLSSYEYYRQIAEDLEIPMIDSVEEIIQYLEKLDINGRGYHKDKLSEYFYLY